MGEGLVAQLSKKYNLNITDGRLIRDLESSLQKFDESNAIVIEHLENPEFYKLTSCYIACLAEKNGHSVVFCDEDEQQNVLGLLNNHPFVNTYMYFSAERYLADYKLTGDVKQAVFPILKIDLANKKGNTDCYYLFQVCVQAVCAQTSEKDTIRYDLILMSEKKATADDALDVVANGRSGIVFSSVLNMALDPKSTLFDEKGVLRKCLEQILTNSVSAKA